MSDLTPPNPGPNFGHDPPSEYAPKATVPPADTEASIPADPLPIPPVPTYQLDDLTPEMAQGELPKSAPPPPPTIGQQSNQVMPVVTCVSCGYDLRGMSLEQTCPECGTLVKRSTLGFFMHHAPLDWLRTIRCAAGCVTLSGIILITGLASLLLAGMIVGMTRSRGAERMIEDALPYVSTGWSLLTAGFFTLGAIQFAAADPRDRDIPIDVPLPNGAKRYILPLLRGMAGIALASHVLFLIAVFADSDLAYVGWVAVVGWLVATMIASSRAAQLCRTMPRPGLAVQFKVVRYGILSTVVLTVLSIVLMISLQGGGGPIGTPTGMAIGVSVCMGLTPLLGLGFVLYGTILMAVMYFSVRRIQRWVVSQQ